MKRITYLVSRSERYTGFDVASLVAPELRVPLVVLACALAVVALAGVAERMRLGAATADGEAYARRLAAVELDTARVRAVERDVERLRALGASTAQIRRTGDVEAGRIAELGNRVPEGAWLTSLRADRDALAIEGGSTRLDAVAATLSAFARLPWSADVRLVAIHDDPVRAVATYALAVERHR